MPLWHTAQESAAQRVTRAHEEDTGTAPEHVASAPATWPLIGEHVDHFGGLTLVGLSDLRAAAAVSPRKDDVISLVCHQQRVDPSGKDVEPEVTHGSSSLEEAAQLAAAQQPELDDNGQTITPPDPTGGIVQRLAGMVYSMVNRQLLSRDTAGLDITVVTDIPDDAGLGNAAAIDTAVALALLGDSPELSDAPLRARLADICASSAETFSEFPALRARYSAALRGDGQNITVVDYADNSVTHAPHPLTDELTAFVVVPPRSSGDASAIAQRLEAARDIRRRQRFVSQACHAFGAESLRLLPDAPQRVVEWLEAVHRVHGTDGTPRTDEAASWLSFYEAETERAESFAKALRSRRGADLFPLLTSSQRSVDVDYQLGGTEELAQLLALRGAVAARALTAGTSAAVVAYVPVTKASNFAADAAEDGFTVVALRPGAPANLG